MSSVIEKLIVVLLGMLPGNLVKTVLETALTELKKSIIESSTKVDDLVLPLIDAIGNQLNINLDINKDIPRPTGNLPGDYDSRINTVLNDMLPKYNLTRSEVDWNTINNILTESGIWQTKILNYLQSVVDAKTK